MSEELKDVPLYYLAQVQAYIIYVYIYFTIFLRGKELASTLHVKSPSLKELYAAIMNAGRW